MKNEDEHYRDGMVNQERERGGRQIIALGGGGFSMEPGNRLLDRYILAASEDPFPAICFLPTASADSDGYVVRFYEAFRGEACRPTHLPLFSPPVADLRSFIMAQQIIYVGGGNTKSMLAIWREWGVDEILREAWEAGIILAGLSAGSICWFEEGLSDYLPNEHHPIAGLGLIRGSHSPHYDGESARRPAYRRLIGDGAMKPGIAADDGVALHYIDHELYEVVSSRPEARAWRVVRAVDQEEGWDEEEVVPRFLGEDGRGKMSYTTKRG